MSSLKMIVEIPKGSNNKYEFNGQHGCWELDRVLHGAMVYPEEYGYLPATLDYDGDPLDVICLGGYPSFPGCSVAIRVLGILRMIDQGAQDYKIIAVNAVDPRFSHLNSLDEVGNGKLAEISNFFLRYKELENKSVLIEGYGNRAEAFEMIEECTNLFHEYQQLFPANLDKQKVSEFLLAKKKH